MKKKLLCHTGMLMIASLGVMGQAPPPAVPQHATAGANGAAAAEVTLPPDYVIGPDDVLSIVFWREKAMSAEVVVRPDGRISLPLLNDLQAAGYTPDELRLRLDEAAEKFVEEPTAAVVVKAINSRKVYITGDIAKPGTYPLTGDMSVVQLIATAGGLLEYADETDIVVIRKAEGRDKYLKVNYKDIVRQKNVKQNVILKPGDTVIVP